MDDATSKARHATSFGAATRAYERGRPSYPAEALDWLLPDGARRVLDLGAGTGKLTRDLAARGLDVVAVDPSAGMRAELGRVLPDIPVLAGSAEHIPLDAGSVDAVLVAQAWHWVDPKAAVPEIARVLKPGGRLGLLWNVRVEPVASRSYYLVLPEREQQAMLGEMRQLIATDPELAGRRAVAMPYVTRCSRTNLGS